jgi:hypothetical protein
MKTIDRKSLYDIPDYKLIFETESHHEHPVIVDEHDTVRWKEDKVVSALLSNQINLNDLWILFRSMGLTKNSEEMRKLYRDMGYSLSGYWEIFYWETNNEDAGKYKQKKKKRA